MWFCVFWLRHHWVAIHKRQAIVHNAKRWLPISPSILVGFWLLFQNLNQHAVNFMTVPCIYSTVEFQNCHFCNTLTNLVQMYMTLCAQNRTDLRTQICPAKTDPDWYWGILCHYIGALELLEASIANRQIMRNWQVPGSRPRLSELGHIIHQEQPWTMPQSRHQ